MPANHAQWKVATIEITLQISELAVLAQSGMEKNTAPGLESGIVHFPESGYEKDIFCDLESGISPHVQTGIENNIARGLKYGLKVFAESAIGNRELLRHSRAEDESSCAVNTC